MPGLLTTPGPAKAANAVVGTGTSASCTEAAFDAALAAANGGGGTITFNCGAAPKTITLTVGKIVNLADVVIDGGGLISLHGSVAARHFFVGNGVLFTLKNIALRNGDPLLSGGAIEINESKVILHNVELSSNYAETVGGALACFGSTAHVLIDNSRFEDNDAAVSGGAIYNDGCEVTVNDSSFIGNQAAANGGAVFNAQNAVLTIVNTEIRGNQSLDGPGIYNAEGATATLKEVQFLSNAGGYGGGVENSGAITMTNSLLDSNSVTGSGGGIWNMGGTAFCSRLPFAITLPMKGAVSTAMAASVDKKDANIVGNKVATGSLAAASIMAAAPCSSPMPPSAAIWP